MKIRIIKKLVKQNRLTTLKQIRWFNKSITKCTSIRNTVITGMLLNGHASGAMELMLKYDVKFKTKCKWEIVS